MTELFFFTEPLALFLTMALPLLWYLLRLLPLRPKKVVFPSIILLKETRQDQPRPQDIPMWLKVLRLSILFFLILGLAKAVWDPDRNALANMPTVIVIDNSYAAADQWADRVKLAQSELNAFSDVSGIPLTVMGTAVNAQTGEVDIQSNLSPQEAQNFISSLSPQPWTADYQRAASMVGRTLFQTNYKWQTIWFGDGAPGDDMYSLYDRLSDYGQVHFYHEGDINQRLSIQDVSIIQSDVLNIEIARAFATTPRDVPLRLYNDVGEVLAEENIRLEENEFSGIKEMKLPLEMLEQVSTIEIGDTPLLMQRWAMMARTSGLTGIAAAASPDQKQDYLNDVFYIDRAAATYGQPVVDRVTALIENTSINFIVLPDSYELTQIEAAALSQWVNEGGFLLRFAGPRLAENGNTSSLLPVEIYSGGRNLGGTMSWSTPATPKRFSEDSPFSGFQVPDQFTVSRQVLARPSINLDERTWLYLNDNTPLITSSELGGGQVTFVHTAANTAWSDFIISDFFPVFLNVLANNAAGISARLPEDAQLKPSQVFNAFGQLQDFENTVQPITFSELKQATLSYDQPAGIYQTDGGQSYIRNFGQSYKVPEQDIGDYYYFDDIHPYGQQRYYSLSVLFILLSVIMFIADLLFSARLIHGKFLNFGKGFSYASLLFLILILIPQISFAAPESLQGDKNKIDFAYIITGDDRIDQISQTGLQNLGDIAKLRTTIEFNKVTGVTPGQDELNIYPFLYWPMTSDQSELSDPAINALQGYINHGGLIVFDTRDGRFSDINTAPGAEQMKRLAQRLKFDPLMTLDRDHVLARSYYLLEIFPGLYQGRTIWLEETNESAYDGAPSVIVGANDWAGAWAKYSFDSLTMGGNMNANLENAMRFGINLAMLSLTGNYKADQIHVDNILKRIEQND